ncbi:uncharacterized protein ACOB8E_004998 [Sarcophilus harrisii]
MSHPLTAHSLEGTGSSATYAARAARRIACQRPRGLPAPRTHHEGPAKPLPLSPCVCAGAPGLPRQFARVRALRGTHAPGPGAVRLLHMDLPSLPPAAPGCRTEAEGTLWRQGQEDDSLKSITRGSSVGAVVWRVLKGLQCPRSSGRLGSWCSGPTWSAIRNI